MRMARSLRGVSRWSAHSVRVSIRWVSASMIRMPCLGSVDEWVVASVRRYPCGHAVEGAEAGVLFREGGAQRTLLVVGSPARLDGVEAQLLHGLEVPSERPPHRLVVIGDIHAHHPRVVG